MNRFIKIIRKNIFHIITILLIIVSLFCTIFLFPNSLKRIIQSIIDFWNSLRYYFVNMLGLDINIEITVNDLSNIQFTPFFNLPASFEEFKENWLRYWQIWKTSENFNAYLSLLISLLYNISKIIILLFLPLYIVLKMLFKRYLKNVNNNYNEDSKFLKLYKNSIAKIANLIIKILKNYLNFIKNHKFYIYILASLWLFSFNIITIIIEFISYYLYFAISFDFRSIYTQIYKFVCDISVMLAFLPPVVWLILLYVLFDKFRKKVGYRRLNHFENKDCGFISDRAIVTMIVGTMGKKKTTLLSDMALSEEVILRNKAYKLIIENDFKFPHFPWINLENSLKYAIKKHIIYNLATIKKYINHLKQCFFVSQKYNSIVLNKCIRRHLKKRLNIPYANLCFDYDYTTYGLYYDDNLRLINLWEVIETYSQLYFIYIVQSSLIISNYSVRTDNIVQNEGNFPVWDYDFFVRKSKDIDLVSRHSKIIDFDAFRLGKKVIEDNLKQNSFEFGVVLITEVGKERKNNLELKDTKKMEFLANQKNDGFNDYLKMCRHSATVDNYPFIKFITDEQRPESWGSDARDLCEIIHIDEVSEKKLTMPFFATFELLYDFVCSKFLNLYKDFRYYRGDNTLIMFLLKNISSKIFSHYHRIYNMFGYFKLDISVEQGTQQGQLKQKKYYLMTKKIYSKRFVTDCFSDYFSKKSLKSRIGLADLEEYVTERASFEELKKQNSYFITDLIDKMK